MAKNIGALLGTPILYRFRKMVSNTYKSSYSIRFEYKVSKERGGRGEKAVYLIYIQFHQDKRCGDSIFLLTINKPLRISFRVDNLWAKG